MGFVSFLEESAIISMKIKVHTDCSVSYELGVYICDRQMLAFDCLVSFCFCSAILNTSVICEQGVFDVKFTQDF